MFKPNRKKVISVLLAVCLSFSAAGCDLIDEIKNEFSLSDETVNGIYSEHELSNSISLGLLDFDTFNPLLTKSETVKECMEFVYEPLFDINEKLEPVPVLARDYSVSADGRTVEINLKENVQWHDGSYLTAYDVAYTIKQIRSGITEYTDALIDMADYTAVEERTIRISLNYAAPNFVSLLTFPIVQYQTSMKQNPDYIPIGTGAFRYETQLSTERLSFIAFDGYHGGKAQIDNVYVYLVPDIQKYESMFEASEIDLITGETVDLSDYTPRGSIKNNEYITNKMTFAGFNLRNSLFWGAETRIGLAELIDKDYIVNSVIYSRGVPCDVPINPSSIYYYDTNTKFASDDLSALSHLGNDGWGLDSDGKYIRRVNENRETLSFELLTDSDSDEKVSIANTIAERFSSFGIPVTVVALPYEEYISRINNGGFDMMIGEIEIRANLDLSPLISSAGNYFSYMNVSLDTLTGQMGMTTDEEQLKTLFVQYGDSIKADMPFTPLFFRKGNVISSAKLKSDVVPSAGRLYREVNAWSVKQ